MQNDEIFKVSINKIEYYREDQVTTQFNTIPLYVSHVSHVRIYVTLSHLRSKESTGIHKPCIPILLHI